MRYLLILLIFSGCFDVTPVENIETYHVNCRKINTEYRINLSTQKNDRVFWLVTHFKLPDDSTTWEYTKNGINTGLSIQNITERTNYSYRAISGTGKINGDTIELRNIWFEESLWAENFNLICSH